MSNPTNLAEAEATETPEVAPEGTEEVQQPADVTDLVLGAQIDTPTGSLTIRPNQSISDFNPEQRAAMLAIGIDTANDPGVLPHLRAFVHMCQIRNLDPFAREAYLIGRGKGDFRKWTMQTGIDGYRKMAKATGQFIRVKKTLWTGSDDDDRSYVRTQDEDGDFVMQRVWFDQWPANRGNPGAAKVVIEHRDATGEITTTSAVADWSMYAPYTDEYVGPKNNRQKKIGPDGKPVRVLNEMWTKGGPHMLAKCAEALAHRRAFPAAMSGIYVSEEMHRLDQQERDRENAERARARREALSARRREEQDGSAHPAAAEAAPTPASEVVAEVVGEVVPGLTEKAVAMLRAEFEWQADVLGQEPTALASRRIKALGKPLGEFTSDELFTMVNGYRSLTAQAATKSGHPLADAYAYAAQDGAAPFDIDALALDEDDDAAVDAEVVSDEAEPHLYVPSESDETCWSCGGPKDMSGHIAPSETEGDDQ